MIKQNNLAWFLTVLAITALMGSISWISLNGLIFSSSSVEKTYEKIVYLNQTYATIVDMESSLRGYVITGEEDFLQNYSSGEREWKNSFRGLKSLTETAEGKRKNADLEELINEKIALMEDLRLTREKQGYEAGKAIIIGRKGKSTSDQIKSITKEIEKDLNKDIEDTTSNTKSKAQQTLIFVIAGILIYATFITILPSLNKKV
jgi:CHASE3 domain sensor protein